jgi:very-short-patch-repair endonuclease
MLVARLAERQHGCVTYRQLLELGLSRAAIAHRVRTGRLIRLYRGVYAVGHRPAGFAAGACAAMLGCGRGAALSHRAAAHLHGFVARPAGPVDVTVPRTRRVRVEGVRVHHADVPLDQIERCQGLLVTSPARTIVDLAATEAPGAVERALSEAFALRLVSRASVLAVLDTVPRARGGPALRDMLDAGRHRAQSHPERLLHRLILEARLPSPELNAKLGPWKPDLLWRQRGLVVEVDGYAAHSSPRAIERDRRKEAALRAMGLQVVRYSARQVEHDHLAVLVDLARALERLGEHGPHLVGLLATG